MATTLADLLGTASDTRAARRPIHVQYRRVPIFPPDDEAMLVESMKLAQDGERQAYALVLEHCRKAFDRLARERCPAGSCEVEIVHQCLVTLHHARHTFDPNRSFAAWVDGIALNHGIGCSRLSPARGRLRVSRSGLRMLVEGVMAVVGHRTWKA